MPPGLLVTSTTTVLASNIVRQKMLWCYDWGWFLVGHNYTMLISKQGSIDNIFYCSNLQHKVPPFHMSMQIWLSNWLKHNYCLPWALFRYYENVRGIHTTNHMVTSILCHPLRCTWIPLLSIVHQVTYIAHHLQTFNYLLANEKGRKL